MTRRWWIGLAATAALVAAEGMAGGQEQPWRLRIGPLAVESSHDPLLDPSWGLGVDLEYRISSRLGVDVGVLTAEVRDEPELDFFGIDVDSEVRVTPVMARLNLHLTPGSDVDLHFAPVVAWVKTGEETIRVRADLFGDVEEETVRIPVEDQLTWGASLGFDVPLGASGYLTFEATFLQLDLVLRPPGEDPVELPADFDPLLVQVGYGVRF
jgi:hypothetical protein